MAKPTKHYGKWRIRWVDGEGRRRSETHDDYQTAKTKLRQHELEADEVRRRLRPGIALDKTFNELCDYWLENRAIRKRSAEDDRSIIRKHLRPSFGTLRVREIGVTHIDRFIAERQHLGKKTIANLLTLLRAMMNAAVELLWLHRDAMPKIRKPRIPLFTDDFRYLRTDEEINRFLRAAKCEGEAVFVLYAAAVYTGLREGELAGLHWDDISLERRLITVQRSFDGPTKPGDVRYVPILDPLLPILREWRLRHPGQLVFTGQTGNMLCESARVFQDVLHRVLKLAELPEIDRNGKRSRYITFHGLRHTFASHWMMKGGDLFKLQKILGHKSVQMTMRYAHLAPSAFAEDYGRFGSLAPTRDADVVAILPAAVDVTGS